MSKVLKRIGTINYKNGKYANIFMIGNFETVSSFV